MRTADEVAGGSRIGQDRARSGIATMERQPMTTAPRMLPAGLIAVTALAIGLAIPAASAGQASDAEVALRLARLQAEIATLRSQVEALDRQSGVNGHTFRLGNANSNDIVIGPGGATIAMTHNQIRLSSDRIILDAKAIELNGTRTIAAKGGAISLDGDSVSSRALGDTTIKGSKIGSN
jgi:hypothetical protein